ncbi:MAG: ATP synthase subunit I [Burkholderiaceae bacterium]|nr:ATP synthase subunit I [Burkholderiaceae bacterium]
MTIAPQPYASTDAENPDGLFDAEFKPLTAEEAQQWRRAHPAISPWWVIVWQVVVGTALALVAGWWGGEVAGLSAAYGALAVVFPAALMVRGLQRQRAVTQPGAAMMGFVIWESVKVALTVAMLLAAPKVVSPLSWLALVAGFVVTMKVYWVAAWLHSRRRSLNGSN